MPEKKTVIIVVDDDAAVRSALKFSLELDGLIVHACQSGEELFCDPALADCGCIVLDYEMPAMSGMDVLDRLAMDRVVAPVIFMAGPVTPEIRRRALGKGACLVLEKPLLDGSLSQQIHKLTTQVSGNGQRNQTQAL